MERQRIAKEVVSGGREIEELLRTLEQTRRRLDSLLGEDIAAALLSDPSSTYRVYEALLKSDEFYRILFRDHPQPAWIAENESSRLLDVNEAAEAMYGYEREELLLLSEDDLTITRGESYQRHRTKDGAEVLVELHSHPISCRGATFKLVLISDVTEKIEAEEEHRRSARRMAAQAALIDQASDAILVHSLETRLLYWSRGAHVLYGWSPEEATGRKVEEVCGWGSLDPRELVERVRRSGEWAAEIECRDKAGNALTVFARWTLLRDAFGEAEAILAIHSDITERKELQEQLRRSQRLESIGTLAGGIAHDLNNVLAPIVMAVELLSDPQSHRRSEVADLLTILKASAHRGADLVKQILTFARGSEGEQRRVDPRDVVRDLERLVVETFPRNIAFRKDLPPRLWTLKADSTQLHQMLLNLCVNARDALPDGGIISVAISNVELSEPPAPDNRRSSAGPHLRIVVEDNGRGMPAAVKEKMFEPFFTTKEPGRGTGLGLAIVFTIVRDHGGAISVESEPGKGTRIQILLPALTSTGVDPIKPTPLVTPRGEGEWVLFVDDEASIRNLAAKVLERNGYRVLTAANGAEGVATFKTHQDRIAAVVTDISMPVMDGPSMVEILRELAPELRVIGSSGRGSSGQETNFDAAGFDLLLAKPYDISALVSALHRLLEGSPARTGIRKRTVLAVDDDETLLKLVARGLAGEGYIVLTASNAQQARKVLEGEQSIDCVFCDYDLPGLKGPALKALVRELQPGAAVLLSSGVPRESTMLLKPFSLSELKRRVGTVLR